MSSLALLILRGAVLGERFEKSDYTEADAAEGWQCWVRC